MVVAQGWELLRLNPAIWEAIAGTGWVLTDGKNRTLEERKGKAPKGRRGCKRLRLGFLVLGGGRGGGI
jgi:hypothetical protein